MVLARDIGINVSFVVNIMNRNRNKVFGDNCGLREAVRHKIINVTEKSERFH